MGEANKLEAAQPDVEDGIQYWTTQTADYNGVLGEHRPFFDLQTRYIVTQYYSNSRCLWRRRKSHLFNFFLLLTS